MTRIAPAPARNPIVRGTYREVRRRFGRNLENVEIMEPQIAQLAASGCAGGLYFGGGAVARHAQTPPRAISRTPASALCSRRHIALFSRLILYQRRRRRA